MRYFPAPVFAATLLIGTVAAAAPGCAQSPGAPTDNAPIAASFYSAPPVGSETDGAAYTGKKIRGETRVTPRRTKFADNLAEEETTRQLNQQQSGR
jgi:hypothetical protein